MAFRFVHHLKRALFDFRHVASFFPSSRYSVRAVMRHVPSPCKVIVEYGPGTGILTRPLLDAVADGGELITIERNPSFAHDLRQLGDARLRIEEGDVLDRLDFLLSHRRRSVDVVVSGIPFSFLPMREREQIVGKTGALLTPDGRFIVYQNSLKLLALLRRNFDEVRYSFEPRNFLPYFIMVAMHPKQALTQTRS